MEEARRGGVKWLDESGPAAALGEYLSQHWAERFGLVGVG
jgi:hypothetical protein